MMTSLREKIGKRRFPKGGGRGLGLGAGGREGEKKEEEEKPSRRIEVKDV